MKGLFSDIKKTSKNIAVQVARQMAQEPLEVLKEGSRQVAGDENLDKPRSHESPEGIENKENQSEAAVKNDKIKSQRLYDAYKKEIDDIRREKVFKDIQARITQGEYVPLLDYPELLREQREVLAAQYQAVQEQKRVQIKRQEKGTPQIATKPSRRMIAGQKTQMQREQTRVEKPMPPSG
ncbi:hypothetical protein HY045_00560 [Candidatus Woesebacteria bacterium]|nr:hypothetical protein [Candidatus Woesebacteria bacterium]